MAHARPLDGRQQASGARVLAGAGRANPPREAPAEIRVRRGVHSGDDHEQAERGGERLRRGAEAAKRSGATPASVATSVAAPSASAATAPTIRLYGLRPRRNSDAAVGPGGMARR